MNGYTYHNIFETKGIEYIAIIIFFMILIPFWLFLNNHKEIKQKIRNIIRVLNFEILKIPLGIFIGENHTWMFLEKSGYASIGLDDFILHTTGRIKIKFSCNIDYKINKGELLFVIEKENKMLKIFSPVTGKITQNNLSVNENSDLLFSDPYNKGWLVKIKPDNWVNETQSYYLAEDAINWSKNELQRFKDFIALSHRSLLTGSSMAVLQDGGELVDNILSDLPENVWTDFQDKFLKIK